MEPGLFVECGNMLGDDNQAGQEDVAAEIAYHAAGIGK